MKERKQFPRGEHIGYPENVYPDNRGFLQRYLGKIFLGGALAIAVAGAAVHSVRNMGETVFDETVSDGAMNARVIYEEGRFCWAKNAGFTKNEMTLRMGEGREIIFTDLYHETGLDCKADDKPDFAKDKLEQIVIKDGETVSTYRRDSPGEYTVDPVIGEIDKGLFFEGVDGVYNHIRTAIRGAVKDGGKDIYITAPEAD